MNKLWSLVLMVPLFLTLSSAPVHGQGWNRHDTRNYTILSQLDNRSTRQIGQMMEKIFSEYSKRFQFSRKVRGHFILKVFRTRKGLWEYIRTIGGSPNWLGAYIRSKKELVVTSEVSRAQFRSLLFHEGFHQFLEYYIPNPPVWLNEGLAEYFGAAVPKYSGLKFGVPLREHILLLNKEFDMAHMPGIGQVVTANYVTFHKAKTEKYYYAKSWLLVHFLIKKHINLLNKMLKNLKRGKKLSYTGLFGTANGLEMAMRKYLKEIVVTSGEKHFQMGKSRFDRGKHDSAARLFTQSLTKNPHHIQARHYRGVIHYEKKNYTAAHRDFSKVISTGFDWAPTFYYRGLCEFFDGKKDAALRDLQIARRLAPNNRRIQNAIQHVLNSKRR